MRRSLLPLVTLLLPALLLAPPALAEEGETAWSEERPVEKKAEPPAAAEQPAAKDPAAKESAARETVPGRPTSYYQPRRAADPASEPTEAETPAPTPEPFVMPTENTVIGIRKNHNAPWVGNWLAVELDMGFAVVGQAGKHVGATVTFYESSTNRPLRAAMRPYVDQAGNLSVYTQLVPVKENSRLFRAKLKIPYRAFPWPTKGPTYEVLARVRLMSRDAEGRFEVLARSETGFSIHYEKGCGCVPPGRLDCKRCRPWQWDFGYSWCKMWGDELGPTPSQVPCLPPPKGSGRSTDWYEARWRTRGSSVDEFQKRMDSEANATSAGQRAAR